MISKGTLMATTLLAVTFAGCIGGGNDEFDFRPGANFQPTGNTVHIRMWVADMVQSEIYPGFKANLWAFCAEPADPNDAYSRAAIEYRNPVGTVQVLKPDGTFEIDDEQTNKCSVPGPQLRVKQGDRVIVEFINDHFHPHTIHWHGQYVPWESDGVPGNTQDSVVKGTSFTYDFIARRAGTMWYHCHVDVQFHVMQGLYGVIIVEPQDQTYEPKDIDREYTLVLSTLKRELVQWDPNQVDPHAEHKHGASCGASGMVGCQNPSVDVTPDTFLINGRSAPNSMMDDQTIISIDTGERVRLRFLNAGETVEMFHTHGHDMLVTHIDGNPLPPAARYYVDTLMIGPAQRIDVVIEGLDEPGAWMSHTHVEEHVTNDHQFPGGMMTMIVYPGYEDKMRTFQSELWGGVDIPPDLSVPDDLILGKVARPASTPPNVDGAPEDPGEDDELAVWSFPVDQPCAVDDVTVTVIAIPDSPSLAVFNDLRVTIVDAAGNERLAAPIDPETGDVTWHFDTRESGEIVLTEGGTPAPVLPAGEYTVTVGGNLVSTELQLGVYVDHFDNMANALTTAKAEGWPDCGVAAYLPDVI